MLLIWRVRVLDSRDRTFRDRDLTLETDALDLVNRAAVEYRANLDKSNDKAWLQFRRLFREGTLDVDECMALVEKHGRMKMILLHDYFEDETGNELSLKRCAELLTGSATAVLLPPGAKPHDVEYMLADKPPIDLTQISLSPNELETLGYFTRDLREMLASAFYRDGPGTLSGPVGGQCDVKTSVTDAEIRSFVTIFRRLYMEDERGNFFKTVKVFSKVLHRNPIGRLVSDIRSEHARALNDPPFLVGMLGFPAFAYSCRKLIDVLIYTQYAHQPSPDRVQEFEECKAALGGQPARLTWLTFATLHDCCLHIGNAGIIIAEFYECYCRAHNVTVKLISSIADENPGIGTLEKEYAREARLFEEAAAELGTRLWGEAGCPEGRKLEFEAKAKADLSAALMAKSGTTGF